MSNNNGNMPAMPFVDSGFGQYKPEAYAGLTKREMMAMHMMASLTGTYWESFGEYRDGKHLVKCQAETAVEMADALLKELSK